MKKDKFLKILRLKLHSLPKEERESAVAFYEDYFSDSDDEEEALSKLADPKEIAGKLLIEFGEKNKSVSGMAIVLAVISAPLTLPLGFASVMCIFALIITLVFAIISLFIFDFSIFLVGLTSLIAVIPAFIHNIGTGFLHVGIILISFPVACFFLMFCMLLMRKFLNLIKKSSIKLLKRRYDNEK